MVNNEFRKKDQQVHRDPTMKALMMRGRSIERKFDNRGRSPGKHRLGGKFHLRLSLSVEQLSLSIRTTKFIYNN